MHCWAVILVSPSQPHFPLSQQHTAGSRPLLSGSVFLLPNRNKVVFAFFRKPCEWPTTPVLGNDSENKGWAGLTVVAKQTFQKGEMFGSFFVHQFEQLQPIAEVLIRVLDSFKTGSPTVFFYLMYFSPLLQSHKPDRWDWSDQVWGQAES